MQHFVFYPINHVTTPSMIFFYCCSCCSYFDFKQLLREHVWSQRLSGKTYFGLVVLPVDVYTEVLKLLFTFHSRLSFTKRVHLDPTLKKVFFRINFGTTLPSYLYTLKTTTNQQKENQKHLPFPNGGQYTNFLFAETVMWPIFEKNNFFSMKFGSQ